MQLCTPLTCVQCASVMRTWCSRSFQALFIRHLWKTFISLIVNCTSAAPKWLDVIACRRSQISTMPLSSSFTATCATNQQHNYDMVIVLFMQLCLRHAYTPSDESKLHIASSCDMAISAHQRPWLLALPDEPPLPNTCFELWISHTTRVHKHLSITYHAENNTLTHTL